MLQKGGWEGLEGEPFFFLYMVFVHNSQIYIHLTNFLSFSTFFERKMASPGMVPGLL